MGESSRRLQGIDVVQMSCTPHNLENVQQCSKILLLVSLGGFENLGVCKCSYKSSVEYLKTQFEYTA